MRRVCTLVVLVAVSFNAMWCLDGCIDPFASKGASSTTAASTSSGTTDSQETWTCVVCVVPFEEGQTVVLEPAWDSNVVVRVYAVSSLLAPRGRIEHPPRTL